MTSTITSTDVLVALQEHIGEANGIKGSDLAAKIVGGPMLLKPRHQRLMRKRIEEMRRAGVHICGKPDTGYFLAATDEELLETIEFLYSRAITGLTQAAAMRGVSLPDLRGELRLDT